MDDETPGVGPATTETPAPGTGETVTPGTDPAETSATGTGATGTGADGTGEGIVPPRRSFLQDYGFLILIGVFFYFLMLRPERARKRQRQEMLSALKKNDRIVTSSGILGVVTEVQKDEVTLRIDDEKNVRIRITRSAVANVLTASGENKTTP
ncbi:MAG: preprotein translocase subunit YajC [Planctomycetes bacterium]|nr:preprotein translocase subunit YajC [Planctomycetota bacterium]